MNTLRQIHIALRYGDWACGWSDCLFDGTPRVGVHRTYYDGKWGLGLCEVLMMTEQLRWKRIGNHDLPIPRQAKHGDAGYDLAYSGLTPKGDPRSSIVLYPFDAPVMIPTGWAVAIPYGYVGLIRERSGAAKRGMLITGGVIDSGYRGEIALLVACQTDDIVEIKAGERIAQLIIVPCLHHASIEVDSLDETERGADGFGSTGEA